MWSVLDGTPAGVTIHYIDAGVDTGDIVAQERVELLDEWTLEEAYDRLQEAMVALFEAHWPAIKVSDQRPPPATPGRHGTPGGRPRGRCGPVACRMAHAHW